MAPEEVCQELINAHEVFRLANKMYEYLPQGKAADELAAAIKNARAEFIKLDVLLEDIQWDITAHEIKEDVS